MAKECTRLKLLVDADAWQFLGKTKLTFHIFCSPPPRLKNVPAPLGNTGTRHKPTHLTEF